MFALNYNLEMNVGHLSNHRRACTKKLIQPCPPSNPDCHCNEIHTPEGTYTLMHEIYQETAQPQFSSGTHVSFFCPTSTVVQQQKQQQRKQPEVAMDQSLGIPESVHTPNSSVSDLPTTEEEEDNGTESSSSPEFPSDALLLPSVHVHPLPPSSTSILSRSQSEAPHPDSHVLSPCRSDPLLCTITSAAESHSKPVAVQQQEQLYQQQDPHILSSGGSLSSLFSHSKSHHKKPKTSLTKLKTSFIEYVTTHPNEKVMHEERTSIFFNVGLNFFWMDYNEPKVHDTLE